MRLIGVAVGWSGPSNAEIARHLYKWIRVPTRMSAKAGSPRRG